MTSRDALPIPGPADPLDPMDPMERRADPTTDARVPFELPRQSVSTDAGDLAEPDVPSDTDVAPAGSQSRSRWRSGLRERRAKPARRSPWWELPLLIAVAILVAIGVKTFLVQPFYIPSASMEKTLHGCPGCAGDRILVNKTIYHVRDPKPGDIVVFKLPAAWQDSAARDEIAASESGNVVSRTVRWFGQLIGFVPPNEKDLVKRVIAVGGQTVKCCDSQGRVQVSDNGTAGPWRSLDEPYIFTDGSGVSATFGPVTIPAGRLWVMGDHRNDSADSRVHCGSSNVLDASGQSTAAACDPIRSTVSDDDVIGKAVLIIWPVSRWRTLGTPTTFNSAAGGSIPLAPLLALGVVVPFGFRGSRRRRSVVATDEHGG
jgi:signal peptidase I